MELHHRFTVPTGVEQAWAHFNDIAAVAECFPGASVAGVEDETFTGSVKVKLGPIALVYNGSGTFVSKDEEAHRFVVEAKGKDKRGNGTAGATVTLSMVEVADGASTDVEVLTDLAITGKPAQFGRGVMQDVSDKLLGQFVGCLEQRMGADGTGEGDEPASAPAEPAATPAESTEPTEPAEPAVGEHERAASATPPPPPPPSPPPPPRPGADSVDLGAAVLPVLARTYWKPGLGALLVVLLVWRWVRRGDD